MTAQERIDQCIELAKQGSGFVSPNPMVGCVIEKQGKVLATGYHHKHGDVHAEIDAMQQLSDEELQGATLYVNLEPCSHRDASKINPPCAQEIIKKGIGRVIIGMQDPNPKVDGGGISLLKSNNIDVELVSHTMNSKYLNRFFIVNQKEKRPFVTLKIAQTLDGYIAPSDDSEKWITDLDARKAVHQMRHDHDAILVGSGTMIADDPSLTVRHVKGRNPIRVVLDSSLKSSPDSHVFTHDEAKTILFTQNNDADKYENNHVEVIRLETSSSHLDLHQIFAELYNRKIYSVLVEAGPHLTDALIESKCVDEIILMIAPKVFGNGIHAFQSESIEKSWENLTFVSQKIEHINQQIIFKGMVNPCLQD